MQKVCKPPNARMIGRCPGGIAFPAPESVHATGTWVRLPSGNSGSSTGSPRRLIRPNTTRSPPFKGMALACDRHRGRKVLVTGSLAMFPSTGSTTTS